MSSEKAPVQVIVVGSGLAGLSASLEAHRNGANVVLLEKNNFLGGNSMMASSGINAFGTPAQKELGISDNRDSFYQDTMKSGGNLSSPNLVSILVDESIEAHEFLKSFGIDLSVISQCGAHSYPRTHRAKEKEDGKLENIGRHITAHLIDHLQTLPSSSMKIVKGAEVKQLLEKNGQVIGVHYVVGNEKFDVYGRIVLATGGYGGDLQFLEDFNLSKFKNFATTNGPWANGGGMKMAKSVGAQLVDLEQIQIHPTGIVDPSKPNERKKWLAPESLRGSGGILLNHHGNRFVNELGQRDHVSQKILSSCQPFKFGENEETTNPVAFLILNDQAAQTFGWRYFNFYKGKGLIQSVQDVNELADFLGQNVETIKKTLQEYKESAQLGSDKFGKVVFPVIFEENQTFHIIMVTPSIHYTMGGVKISETARVLDEKGDAIKGLFAAGEVTGGIHGANRLAGNSLLECVVFGRRAGKNAVFN